MRGEGNGAQPSLRDLPKGPPVFRKYEGSCCSGATADGGNLVSLRIPQYTAF